MVCDTRHLGAIRALCPINREAFSMYRDRTTTKASRWLATAAGLALTVLATVSAKAQDTIKVGILHSLSGTMAISETTLKEVVMMLIDEQNKKGGLLGKKL
jgi:urea transport system substrate-binding protein